MRNAEFRRPSRSRRRKWEAEGATHFRAAGKRGWPPTSPSPLVSRPTPLAAVRKWVCFPARFRLGSSLVTICQRLTPRAIGFVLALYHHRQLPTFGFTDCWAVSSRPHTPNLRHVVQKYRIL